MTKILMIKKPFGSFEIGAWNLFGIWNLEFGILIFLNRLGEAICL